MVERIYLIIVSREGNHARFELFSKIFQSFNVMGSIPPRICWWACRERYNLCMNRKSLDRESLDGVSWTSTSPTDTGVVIFENPWSWNNYLVLCPFTLCVTVDTLLHFTRHVPTIVNLRLSNRFAETTLLANEKFMSHLFISGHFSTYFELYQCSVFSDGKAFQPMLENSSCQNKAYSLCFIQIQNNCFPKPKLYFFPFYQDKDQTHIDIFCCSINTTT